MATEQPRPCPSPPPCPRPPRSLCPSPRVCPCGRFNGTAQHEALRPAACLGRPVWGSFRRCCRPFEGRISLSLFGAAGRVGAATVWPCDRCRGKHASSVLRGLRPWGAAGGVVAVGAPRPVAPPPHCPRATVWPVRPPWGPGRAGRSQGAGLLESTQQLVSAGVRESVSPTAQPDTEEPPLLPEPPNNQSSTP